MKKIFIFSILAFFMIFTNVTVTFATGFWVGKINNHERPILPYKNEIEENNGYYLGKDEKSVYLTFDCGYENGYTSSILDTLKENDVKATFFITGHYLTSSTDLVRRMTDDGHIIGNHTYAHKHFTKESSSDMLKDISKLEEKYYDLMGSEISHFVRPPAGEFNKEALNTLKNNDYKTIFWSLAYVDWYKDKYNGNDYAYNEVMKRIHNGAIILMHTVSKDNMMDLDKIIKKLKSDGYSFKSLYEL